MYNISSPVRGSPCRSNDETLSQNSLRYLSKTD